MPPATSIDEALELFEKASKSLLTAENPFLIHNFRSFCVETNLDLLFDLLAAQNSIWTTEYSFIILVKSIRFFISSKLNLRYEDKNRAFDSSGKEDSSNHREKKFISVQNNNNNINTSLKARQEIIPTIYRRLLQFTNSFSTRPINENNFPKNRGRHNVAQLCSLCALMFFCLFKDATIVESSPFNLPLPAFLHDCDFDVLFSSPRNHDSYSSEKNNNIDEETLTRVGLVSRMTEILTKPIMKFASQGDFSDQLYFAQKLLQEFFIEFGDQPPTSPHDNFASRSHFLFPLLATCEHGFRFNFQRHFTKLFSYLEQARNHGSPPRDDLATSVDLVVRSITSLIESCNFILKQTVFLPEVLTEESLRLPSPSSTGNAPWDRLFGFHEEFVSSCSPPATNKQDRVTTIIRP